MVSESTTALSGIAQTTVQYVAVGSVGWTDVLVNFFYEWKVGAAIVAIVVLNSAGIFLLARVRMVGIGLMIFSVFVAAWFLNIEKFVDISNHDVKTWQHPAPVKNPFDRA